MEGSENGKTIDPFVWTKEITAKERVARTTIVDAINIIFMGKTFS